MPLPPHPHPAPDPIPSDKNRPEGSSEALVGDWLKKGEGRRKEIVIATKVTEHLKSTTRNTQHATHLLC